MSGKVVVNRCMSLDGFIAGPGHSMDWADDRALADFVAPDDFAEIAAATGAMLVGRRTWEVGDRSQPVAEVVVFSNDFARRRARPSRPWATSTRQAWRIGRNTGCLSSHPRVRG